MNRTNLFRSLVTIFVAFFVSSAVVDVAYASSAPVNVEMTSEENCFEGSYFDAYKLLDYNDRNYSFVPGITGELLLPEEYYLMDINNSVNFLGLVDNDLTPDGLADNSYLDNNHGQSENKITYLANLILRLKDAGIVSDGAVRVDSGLNALPGDGLYLFVLENYEIVPEDNGNFACPFFTANVIAKEQSDGEFKATVICPLKAPKDKSLIWFTANITGQRNIDYRSCYTYAYQPENLPDDIKAEIEEEKKQEEENNETIANSNLAGSLIISALPIILVIAAVLIINNRLKKKKAGKSTINAKTTAQTPSDTVSDTKSAPDQKQNVETSSDKHKNNGDPAASNEPLTDEQIYALLEGGKSEE